MAQGRHFGAKPGLGPAPDDQDFEQEANHDVEEGVEHEREVSHAAPRRGLEPKEFWTPYEAVNQTRSSYPN